MLSQRGCARGQTGLRTIYKARQERAGVIKTWLGHFTAPALLSPR